MMQASQMSGMMQGMQQSGQILIQGGAAQQSAGQIINSGQLPDSQKDLRNLLGNQNQATVIGISQQKMNMQQQGLKQPAQSWINVAQIPQQSTNQQQQIYMTNPSGGMVQQQNKPQNFSFGFDAGNYQS